MYVWLLYSTVCMLPQGLMARHLACSGEVMVVGTHSLTHSYTLLSEGLICQHILHQPCGLDIQ